MTDITIQIDDATKQEAEALFKKMGLSLSGAVNEFINRAIQIQGLPFDSDCHSAYKSKIEDSFRQANEGKLIAFTLDELQSLETMPVGKAVEFLKTRRKESGI